MGNSHHKAKDAHRQLDGSNDDNLDFDPRSPSSRTPVANMVKERKASIVPFNPETPVSTPDYDPRSPSSRTPVADMVKERKLSVVQFTTDENPINENNLNNPKPSSHGKDLQKFALINAQKQADNQTQADFPLQ